MNSSCDEDVVVKSEHEIENCTITVEIDEIRSSDFEYEYLENIETNGEETKEFKSNDEVKKPDSELDSDDGNVDESKKSVAKPTKRPANKRKTKDPDYEPSFKEMRESSPEFEPAPKSIGDRIDLPRYKRTTSKAGCIFINCDKLDVKPVPNVARRKMLTDYKLYILPCNKVCSEHLRDQNWEELLRCTYSNFKAEHIQGLLELYRQISDSTFNFEEIEHIPSRILRYFLNVNKVQFQRIFDSFPSLRRLISPKTSLSMYLMFLQHSDVERMSLLLQIPESKIMNMIKEVQDMVFFKTYQELNEKFSLEY